MPGSDTKLLKAALRQEARAVSGWAALGNKKGHLERNENHLRYFSRFVF